VDKWRIENGSAHTLGVKPMRLIDQIRICKMNMRIQLLSYACFALIASQARAVIPCIAVEKCSVARDAFSENDCFSILLSPRHRHP